MCYNCNTLATQDSDVAVEGGFAINRFLPVLACHLLVAALATATRAEQESPGATAPASGPTGLNPGRQPINQFVFTGPMSAHPGDLVDLAVSGTTDPHIKGYSIVLQWDPAVFVLSSGPTLTGTRGQGAFLFTESHNTRGIKAAVIYSIACPPEVPRGRGRCSDSLCR